MKKNIERCKRFILREFEDMKPSVEIDRSLESQEIYKIGDDIPEMYALEKITFTLTIPFALYKRK